MVWFNPDELARRMQTGALPLRDGPGGGRRQRQAVRPRTSTTQQPSHCGRSSKSKDATDVDPLAVLEGKLYRLVGDLEVGCVT